MAGAIQVQVTTLESEAATRDHARAVIVVVVVVVIVVVVVLDGLAVLPRLLLGRRQFGLWVGWLARGASLDVLVGWFVGGPPGEAPVWMFWRLS